MMKKNEKMIALVTGASSGIGQATATRLAEAGYQVFGTSRQGASTSRSSFEMLSLDVTDDASVKAAVAEVIQREGRLDLLVNNAGFNVSVGGAEESSIEQAKDIFNTNFFGVVRMSRAVIPHMRRQGSGRIINIGSVLGFMPMPYMALYAATKHAINGYSESLDHELRNMGIRVSVIEPAFMKTAIDANARDVDAKLDEYREVRMAMDKRLKEMLDAAEDPCVVADTVLKAASAVILNPATPLERRLVACDGCTPCYRTASSTQAYESSCDSLDTVLCQPSAPRVVTPSAQMQPHQHIRTPP